MDGRRPLGGKTYGRIPHLPGSRLGLGERHVSWAQARRMTTRPHPGDSVWVQEKLDGTNVAVARLGDELAALTRAGYLAGDSRRVQARLFDAWVQHHAERFLDVLQPGERAVGEWLLYAHGTRYDLPHEPFVVFDVMQGARRLPLPELTQRLAGALVLPALYAKDAADPAELYRSLRPHGHHGAVTPPEGLVYRVERGGEVEVVAKWVHPGYVTGAYFEQEEAVLPNGLRPEDENLLRQLERGLEQQARRPG